MQDQSPIIPGIDMAKRYKAVVRLLDGSDVRVYSTREHPTSCHGLQVWCDRGGNAYGQIDLRNPLYIVHAIEEFDDDEAAIFDGYASRRAASSRGGSSRSRAKTAAARANGKKGGRPKKSAPALWMLTYTDGRHYHEYAKPMTIEHIHDTIERRVRRHFYGTPEISYLDWSDDEIEVFVRYPTDTGNGRAIAHIEKSAPRKGAP